MAAATHTIEVTGISDETLLRLDERVRQQGLDRDEYIRKLLDKDLHSPSITEILEPLRKQISEGDTSEEELDQLFAGAREEVYQGESGQIEVSSKKQLLPVVFDCMVFLQGAARVTGPSAACLKLVEDDEVELFLSAPILAEIRDVLTRPKLQRKFPILTQAYVDSLLLVFVNKASILQDPPHEFTYERDPKDEPYINLAIAADASYLVSRDNDLLDLMVDSSFCEQFPRVKIVDPISFLRIVREWNGLPNEIAGHLRLIYDFPDDTRIDVTLTREGSFEATAVISDGSTSAIDGSYKKTGDRFVLAPLRQPDLTLEQLKIYDDVLRSFTNKLLEGEEEGLKTIPLVLEGDYPELFDALGESPTIAGSVNFDMLSVWHSLDHMLRFRGYRSIMRIPHEESGAAILAEKHTPFSY